MSVTENIITHQMIIEVKKLQPYLIEELSKNDKNWAIEANEELIEKWTYIIKNIQDYSEDNKTTILSLLLLSYLKTDDMVNYLNSIYNKNPVILMDIIKKFDFLEEEEYIELKKILENRIAFLFKLKIIPKIYSQQRLDNLEKSLNNY